MSLFGNFPKFSKGDDGSHVGQAEKVMAALFYGVSSLAVIFTNKAILTNYDFPYFNFLAAVQFFCTTIIFSVLIYFRMVEVPPLTWGIAKEILPVSLMFLGNIICGLGSTKALNLPMLTALRRVSILMTMLAEIFFLNSRPTVPVVASICTMVGGALIASMYDLSFDAYGYVLVFFNNIFTCLNGVWLKKASLSAKCGKMGVLFYSSLFSLVFMVAFFIWEGAYYASTDDDGPFNSLFHLLDNARRLAVAMPDVSVYTGSASSLLRGATVTPAVQMSQPAETLATAIDGAAVLLPMSGVHAMSSLQKIMAYPGWNDWKFVLMFSVAASMGCLLNYSIFVCTTVNSALTTAVIGALKNVLTAYISMIVFSDYSFGWMNFIGINISILGSLYYTYIVLFKGAVGFGSG
jgi:drug/metabolite transporter (DMT)-like permease